MIAHLITIGFVAVGGAIGAVARYGVNVSASHLFGHGFPWGTLIVNVVGSFLMGVAIVKFAQIEISAPLKTMMITGFLGAFTTFSTFSLDIFHFISAGRYWFAISYLLLSIILGLTAVTLGIILARLS